MLIIHEKYEFINIIIYDLYNNTNIAISGSWFPGRHRAIGRGVEGVQQPGLYAGEDGNQHLRPADRGQPTWLHAPVLYYTFYWFMALKTLIRSYHAIAWYFTVILVFCFDLIGLSPFRI